MPNNFEERSYIGDLPVLFEDRDNTQGVSYIGDVPVLFEDRDSTNGLDEFLWFGRHWASLWNLVYFGYPFGAFVRHRRTLWVPLSTLFGCIFYKTNALRDVSVSSIFP